jgi:membrane protease YdiL (CAAX protease family)
MAKKTILSSTAETRLDKSGRPAISWPPAVAIVIVVVSYFIAAVIGEIGLLLYGLLNGWNLSRIDAWLTDSTVAQFANSLIVYSAMAALVYWFIKRHKTSLAMLGLIRPRLKDFGIALLAAPVYVSAYLLLLAAATRLFPSINVDQKQQLGFQPSQDPLITVLIFISLVVLPPLVEEFVMRGFLFTSLLNRMRFLKAALITSVVFGLAHLQIGSGAPLLWVAAIDTFALSLVLCYLRYKTGSLWAGISLHLIKNLVAFLALFVFTVS